jgi:hypothetical protein
LSSSLRTPTPTPENGKLNISHHFAPKSSRNEMEWMVPMRYSHCRNNGQNEMQVLQCSQWDGTKASR